MQTRKELTHDEKIQVIEYKMKNPTAGMRAIAEKFSCGKSLRRQRASVQRAITDYFK